MFSAWERIPCPNNANEKRVVIATYVCVYFSLICPQVTMMTIKG